MGFLDCPEGNNSEIMKNNLTHLAILFAILFGFSAQAQENQTLFKNSGIHRSGGYIALTNQFTTIDGQYANMPGIYGGWFINRKLMIGIGAAATTNFIPVPYAESNLPGRRMTYQYGQAGLLTEYVVASTKKVHFNVNLLTGTGFSLHYDRREVDDWDWDFDDHEDDHPDFFFVLEPGLQVEFNLLKWMRFSPGISYRKAFGSKANGLSDGDISNLSYNLTLKFGIF